MQEENLHCIGATTFDEYRQYIEKDKALERRFQPVIVDEPYCWRYNFYIKRIKRKIWNSSWCKNSWFMHIVAAAKLSDRYISR